MKQNKFQTCPKCTGTGKRVNKMDLTGSPLLDTIIVSENGIIDLAELKGADNKCFVCNGKMIISTVTGKPPID